MKDEAGGFPLGILALLVGLAAGMWLTAVTGNRGAFVLCVLAGHYGAYRAFDAGLPPAKGNPWDYGKHQ